MKAPDSTPLHSSSRIYVFRLRPHEDLKLSLQKFALENNIKVAVMVTCVGSLEQFHLRFANQPEGTSGNGHFEIVSLVGTLSASAVHLHISISDETGATTGGHLLEKNMVHTTAEIAIAELTNLEFERSLDPASGYPELMVRHL